MNTQLEASSFEIPAFICPECSTQNQRDGQDSLDPVETCEDCGIEVRIID